MNKKESESGILEMMAVNEEKVSDLYKIYSEKFPDYRDFWTGLYVEEIEHAIWIREFRKKIKEGTVYFKEGRFNMYVIENFSNYMRRILDAAKKQEISLESALSTALDIEIALIENRFFEVFETDSEELKFMLKFLEDSTAKHRERVREAQNKARK